MRNSTIAFILLAYLAGCGSAPRSASSFGSHHTQRLQLPPDQAAACFARNAEEHSSALVSEVRPAGGIAQVIVRVKNGVLYATADFQRAGSGSVATISLNVATTSTTGRHNDLLDSLIEGC